MLEVNGKAYVVNPASLLNHDNFTDDEAIVFTTPPVPRYAKPCPAPSDSVPMEALEDECVLIEALLDDNMPTTAFVDEEKSDDPYVVDE